MSIVSPREKHLLLVINPVAGRKQYRRGLTALLDGLEGAGYVVTVYYSRAKTDILQYVALHAGEYDLVVCEGGDGTLNETVSGIVQSGQQVELGYIPTGSTNVFARYHKLPSRIPHALNNLINGRTRALDLGRFNGRSFVYVAACGAFSWLSYSTSQAQKNALGPSAYVLDAIRELQLIKPFSLRLETSDGVHEGDYLFAAVCNVSSLSSALILPEDQVVTDDGLFEVILLRRPAQTAEWGPLLSSVTTGVYTSPLVEFFHADRLHVTCDPGLVWALDGERAEPSGVIDIVNERRCLLLRTRGK